MSDDGINKGDGTVSLARIGSWGCRPRKIYLLYFSNQVSDRMSKVRATVGISKNLFHRYISAGTFSNVFHVFSNISSKRKEKL